MTFGTSIFLIAVGAVLRFAVTVSTSGFNIHTIGVILMIVGVIELFLSALWMTVWANGTGGRRVVKQPRGRGRPRARGPLEQG